MDGSIIFGQIHHLWAAPSSLGGPSSMDSSIVHGQPHHPCTTVSSVKSSIIRAQLRCQWATPSSGWLRPFSSLGQTSVIHDSLLCCIFHIPTARICSWLCLSSISRLHLILTPSLPHPLEPPSIFLEHCGSSFSHLHPCSMPMPLAFHGPTLLSTQKTE